MFFSDVKSKLLSFETKTSDGSEAFSRTFATRNHLVSSLQVKKTVELSIRFVTFFTMFFFQKKNTLKMQRTIKLKKILVFLVVMRVSVCGVSVRVLAFVVVFAFRNVKKSF